MMQRSAEPTRRHQNTYRRFKMARSLPIAGRSVETNGAGDGCLEARLLPRLRGATIGQGRVTRRENTSSAVGSRTLAALACAALALFIGLHVWFYWNGFFRYWGQPLEISANAIYMEIGPDRFSIIPWSRVPIFVASCAALTWCAAASWRRAALARLGSFFIFYGLIAPQGTFLYVHMTDFGVLPRPLALVLSVGLALGPAFILGAPSAFAGITEQERHLAWSQLPFGRSRLIGAGILAAWLFFVAEAYLSRWDFIPNRVGLIAAWMSLVAAPATLFGLLRLRTWSVLTLLLLSALTSIEIVACRSEALARGYVSELGILAGWFGLVAAAAPPILAVAITGPFLRAAGQRLRTSP
jgi:hypothetical protein